MNNKIAIKSFTDLETWKEGHRLVLVVYALTKCFPKEELFGLVSQMRRCVVSITSNIAEGFSRGTFKDKMQFYIIAEGSVTELHNQLIVARDVGYISEIQFDRVITNLVTVHKLLNGLIRSCKRQMPNP